MNVDPFFSQLLSYPSLREISWARSGHLQTIAGHLLGDPQDKTHYSALTISTEDGDILECDWHPGTSSHLILLFHGLAGTSESSYMIRIGALAAALGHSVLRVNHRGAKPGPIPKGIYHSGRSEDLGCVFAWARRHHPHLRQIAIGFSMSANILLLNVAGFRSNEQPDYAITVNAPIDLADTADRLDSGFNRIYSLNFTRDLLRLPTLQKNPLPHDLRWPIGVRQFDELITSRWAGFRDADDYYRTCSAHQYLSRIQIPTLVLTAENDPFVASQTYHSAIWSKSTTVRIEPGGGHLGYLGKTSRGNIRPQRWMDGFLAAALKKITDSECR